MKACSDWLLKVQISFVINLQASPAGFAPENILILTGLYHKPPSLWCLDVNYNKVKQLSFGAFLSGVFSAELPECMQEIMTEKTKDYYQHFLPISEEK